MTTRRGAHKTMHYITCSRKKSAPMVNVVLCERCPHGGRCEDYAQFMQPSLFSPEEAGKITSGGRKRGIEKRETDDETRALGPEQLEFDLRVRPPHR